MSSSQKPPSIPPRKKSGSDDTTSTPSSKPRTGAAARGAAVKSGGSGSAAKSGTTTAEPKTTETSTAKPATAPAPAPAATSPAETSAISLSPAKERPAKDRPAKAAADAGSGPRRVRLTVSRVDPWSVMKLSFLVSFAIGIMLVVAVSAIWLALNGMHVFSSINDLVTEILADSNFDLLDYVAYERVLAGTALISIVNVFLITALSTVGAFIYNISAALVGGVHLTMTDD
ncbi:DUF3566 domain-containing protein [Cellulomonas sp. NPDC089187]|uniref:DUF3566 domain-containing protein n=1 Tax=Cellulomonas sp. NPDC089187 TaxID=3154970 RepID=UPI00343F1C52